MAAKKKKTTAKKPAAKAKKPVKKAKPAAKKSAAKKAAPKKAAPKKAAAKSGRNKDTKTRAQALQEARKKVPRKAKTPTLGDAAAAVSEVAQRVIGAYASASREMAEWLAAARRSDQTA